MYSKISDKLSDKCDDCGKSIKRFHLYQTQVLCGTCYRKHFTIISTSPFGEPFDLSMTFSISLTKTQKKVLDDRLKYLYPTQTRCRVKYLRELINGDIDSWKKKMGDVKIEEKEESEKL